MLKPRLLALPILWVVLLTSCAQSPVSCPLQVAADLSAVAAFASDDQFPFRLPLDQWDASETVWINYCTEGAHSDPVLKYHAAEDYLRPAGTPIYAMADGEISFSGPMGGYGWLIIIDHPQVNLYSLYGHLSPSRWRLKSGAVEKGDLIAYLGDSHENGGSLEQPLEPHLHLGVRAGRRADYPGVGEWRWQAGWIKPCPSDLGWLPPSAIITSQTIPDGGFTRPSAGFVVVWGLELLFTGIYFIGGVCMLIFSIKKNQPLLFIINCSFLIVAGWYFYNKGYKMSFAIFAMVVLFSLIGFYYFIRRSIRKSRASSTPPING